MLAGADSVSHTPAQYPDALSSSPGLGGLPVARCSQGCDSKAKAPARRANIPQSPGHGRLCPQPGRRSRVSVKGQVMPPRGWERCSVSQGPTRVPGPSISLTHPPTTASTPLPSAHTGRPAQGLRLSPLLWPLQAHARTPRPRSRVQHSRPPP